MAVTASGLFLATWIDILDATQLAVNLASASNIKLALFNNSITPNFAGNGNTAYAVAPYNANEVTGTNWAAGGVTLTPTVSDHNGTTANSGNLMFDAADVSVASATFSGARCALIYDNSLSPKAAICLVNFGSDYSPNNGTFQIAWSSGGIFSLDLTP